MEAYANGVGLTIVAFDTDAGLSASSLDRPGLHRALARLDAGEADGLLVMKLDRLTRNVVDLATLVTDYFREDHALLSIGESVDTRSAAGRAMLNLLTMFAQWEREAVAERTALVMQRMRERGEYTGGWPPFGFRLVDGELEPEAEEQTIVERAKQLRNIGMSLRNIAKTIAHNPRTGKPFGAQQIAGML